MIAISPYWTLSTPFLLCSSLLLLRLLWASAVPLVFLFLCLLPPSYLFKPFPCSSALIFFLPLTPPIQCYSPLFFSVWVWAHSPALSALWPFLYNIWVDAGMIFSQNLPRGLSPRLQSFWNEMEKERHPGSSLSLMARWPALTLIQYQALL